MACTKFTALRAWINTTTLSEAEAIEAKQAADLAIWRTAKALIEKHGDMARWEAAGEADKALDKGQWRTVHAWKRVYQTILYIQR